MTKSSLQHRSRRRVILPSRALKSRKKHPLSDKLRSVPDNDSIGGTEIAESFHTLNWKMTFALPRWVTTPQPIKDTLSTESSRLQAATTEECLSYLLGDVGDTQNPSGLPHLDRKRHTRFLKNALGLLPPAFSALDASRPWMLYWCLTGLYLLGEDVTCYRDQYVFKLSSLQSPLNIMQSRRYFDTHTKRLRRLWWWSRTTFPSCNYLRFGLESGHCWGLTGA